MKLPGRDILQLSESKLYLDCAPDNADRSLLPPITNTHSTVYEFPLQHAILLTINQGSSTVMLACPK